MTGNILLLPILIPLTCAILVLLIPGRFRAFIGALTLLATAANFILTIKLFKADLNLFIPWMGSGIDVSFRLFHFSAFTILAAGFFAFLITLYSTGFFKGKPVAKAFFAYLLLNLSFVNGAVLADNLILMLFFWEGLLLTLFGMIAIGNKNAFKTATKAFIILGIADLCMMAGIALIGHISGTYTISRISLPLGSLSSIAFILLMIGAISKSGAMPFHTWIPDAAIDAPLPFMAFIPGSIEKLVGIYFLTRISLDMFKLSPGSWLSFLLMTIGAITLLFAVMMALVQKDYKRLLSYHAISQVGYMILGIGTAVPVGIVGGLFHMINNALYKSGLFLSGGAVEKQTGTTNLEKLGGLAAKMPITFACFLVMAVSISGVPPFNGFFSKELIYDGALERGLIFYIVAVLGSFFTAASFLKLGHAAYLGKVNAQCKDTKEAPLAMLIPMIAIAACCVIFGLFNWIPLTKFIQPILGPGRLEGHDFSGMPSNIKLVIITIVVLITALLNHMWGAKTKGGGLKAVDHIHYAPVLSAIYDKAEKRFFDPYNLGLKIANGISRISWWSDRAIDWVYNDFTPGVTFAFTDRIKKLHNGSYVTYLAWSLIGLFFVVLFLCMHH